MTETTYAEFVGIIETLQETQLRDGERVLYLAKGVVAGLLSCIDSRAYTTTEQQRAIRLARSFQDIEAKWQK